MDRWHASARQERLTRTRTDQQARTASTWSCASPPCPPWTRQSRWGNGPGSHAPAAIVFTVPRAKGVSVNRLVCQAAGAENVARLSPLKFENLNVLGRYSFTPSTPRQGLRPWATAVRPPLDAGSEIDCPQTRRSPPWHRRRTAGPDDAASTSPASSHLSANERLTTGCRRVQWTRAIRGFAAARIQSDPMMIDDRV